MIAPHPKRPDWFTMPYRQDLWAQLAQVPKAQCWGRTIELPRVSLPLFQEGRDYLAAELTAANTTFEQDCLDRNRETEPLGFQLRPHQHVGVAFAARRRGVLVADTPRTGKTLQSLMFHDPACGRLVVITPLPVREVWRGWIARRFPDTEVSVITGQTFDRAKLEAPIVVGHYDILAAWQDASLQIGTLILDEAHVLSNRKSKRTLAAAFLASRAEKIAALTGTPLWNKPQGLWPLLGLVAPGAFGSFFEFASQYTNAVETAWGAKFDGTRNEAELKQRLTEMMLYRRWEDIAPTLPPVTRDILLVDLTAEQRLELDLVVAAGRASSDSSTTIGAIAQYRSTLSLAKAPVAIEAAKADLDNDERVVIWTWHKSTAKHIYQSLRKKYPSFLVTGDVSTMKREEALADWRKTPGAALVITIAVGQVGIDLSDARLAIFAEVDFTPALIAQAEMRTFSPLRPMNVRYLVADHPVERGIIDALRLKLDTGDKLGVPAAEAAIDVLKNAFALPEGEGDLDRLLRDLLASANDAG